jgi:hypothetical protein
MDILRLLVLHFVIVLRNKTVGVKTSESIMFETGPGLHIPLFHKGDLTLKCQLAFINIYSIVDKTLFFIPT